MNMKILLKKSCSVFLIICLLLGIIPNVGITISAVAVENDYIPVIKYKVGTTGEEQQASLQLLTVTCSPSSKTKNQPIYLVSLPYGSILTDWDISGGKENYKTSMYVLGSNSKNNGGNTADNPAFPGDDYYIIGSSFGIDAYSDVTSVKNDQPCYYRYFINMLDGTSLPIPTTETLTGAAYQIKIQQTGTTTTLAYPTVVVQISTVESSGTVSTEELQAEIKKVTGDNEANWHRENDRYNGRDTSTNGFWMDMQAALAVANNCIGNPGTQDIVDAAKASLSDAISKLIPTTQVNATGLYEAVQAYEKLNESDYTSGSWALRSEAVAKAEAMLAELFDEDGDATDANTAVRQAEADALAEEAAKGEVLVPKGAYDEYYGTYQARLQEARNLVDQYDPSRLTAAGYTEESWKAYEAAWETLWSDVNYTFSGGTWADYRMIGQFPNHISALTNARLQLAGSGDVTFSFTYVDNMRSRYPDMGEATAVYRTDSMTLPSGSTTLAAALEEAGITYSTKDIVLPGGGNKSDTDPFLAIYFNGECVGTSYLSELAQSTIQVPNNADVKIVRCVYPLETMEASTGIDSSEWITSLADSSADYADSFALIDMTAPETAAVGDKVKITGSVTGASYSNLGQDLGGEGLTLFVSEPSQTEAFSAPSKETVTVIGADGALEYVFTRPGWYTVALFDQREDVLTATDIFRETTAGTYYSLRAGDFALIHVTQAANPDALLEQYRTEKAAEAERFFAQYHDYDFKAGYYEETFRPLYDGLLANLRAAETFETLMDQYDQDYAALRAAAASAMDHAAILADLRADLALIPGDLSAMDETYKTLVTGIQTAFAGLNDYQKSLLTGNELARLDELADLDADGLRQLADVTVTFYKPGEYEYPFATIQGTFSGTGGAAYYNWPNWNWTSRRQPDGSIPDPDWSDTRAYLERMDAKAGDYVYVRLYLNTTEKQYWPVWSVDGGTTWELFETATYGGVDGYYLATWQVPGDAAEGSSYHISLKMVSRTEYEEILRAGDTEGLDESKANAIAALEAAMAQYRADMSIPVDNLTAINTAMEEGKAAIEAAQTNTEVTEARKAALSAMALAAGGATDVGDVGYDSGETVGRVHVTIENTTYAEGSFYGPGSIVDGWYALGENDSMMTMVLKVLASNGYTWTGTGGTTAGGYDITYLSGIARGDESLTEMQGSRAAGWMGTLNDWFVNLGFNAYTYRNGGLEDGDEIRIMFSLNAGEDLGGTWNNNNTRLADLEITAGTLAPGFSGDVTDYLLVIPEGRATLQLEPEAVNKNFQTRIFLNSYDRDNARYKSGETLSVTSGDVIYVGVGESSWPTMNTGNRGTKYTIQVATLADAIASLPQDSEVTQSNYEVYGQTAKILSALVTTGGYGGDTAKLDALQERVQFFKEITDFETLIDKLPSLETIQAAPDTWREQVRNANQAYQDMSIEQRSYLVSADVNKLLQAVEAVGEEQGGEDLSAVMNFNDKVEAIGSAVTLGSESAINEARTAYKLLTEEQKALVTERYNTLLNAEAALAVVQQIDKIGEVTLEKAGAIADARAAYDAYAGKFSVQNMVSNLDVLEAAEAALEALQGGGQDTSGYREALKEALSYLAGSVTSPIVGSEKGEWAVLAQARAGSLDSTTRTSYLANLRTYVQQRGGELDQSADQTLHTEYSRVVLALTSLGEDAEHFRVGDVTYNLVEPLLEPSQDKTSAYAYQVSEQGNNGTIWALIALDSGGYRNDDEGNAARAAWIDLIIDKQQADGNWPIYNPDQVDTGSELGGVDVCAMAVQALAPYYLDQSRFDALGATHSHAELKSAVDKAVNFLSTSQNGTGGYGSAESSAQVIVALAALGRDAATDSAFTKNSISALAGLLRYQQEDDGSFRHADDGGTNQMASEQAAYALVAYDRYKSNKNSLYDMTDVFTSQPSDTHTIHAEAGAGGSIDPSGTFTVEDGADVTFTITPNDGYQIADIQVDGNSVWAGGSAAQNAMAIISDSNLIEEAETAETCADGTHIGERVVIGRRAATCTEPGYTGDTICGSCGEVLESGVETGLAAHQYASGWQSDATGHWHICLVCGEKSAVEPHVFENEESSDLPETGPEEGPVDPETDETTDPETDGEETLPETGGEEETAPGTGDEETTPGTGGEEETAPGAGDEETTPGTGGEEETAPGTGDGETIPEAGGETSESGTDDTETSGEESEAPSTGTGSQDEGSESEETDGQEEPTAPETDPEEADDQTGGEETGSEISDGAQTEPAEGGDVEETEDETAPTETNDETEEGPAETANLEDSLLSLAGIHPMLLMNVGSGLTPVDAAAPTTEDAVCQVCGYSETAGSTATCDHHGGTATCTALAICQDCGLPYGGYAEHSFTEMAHSSGMHWSVCADCGLEDVSTLTSHSWVLDESSSTETADVYVCLDCGAERTETVAEVLPIPLEENALLTASATTVQTYTLENITSDHTVSVTFEVLTPVIEQEVTVGGDTQTATITNDAISEAVKAVQETSADTITVIPTEVNSGIRAVSVVLPAGSAQSIAGAGAGLAVQTPKGNVTLPEEVLNSIQSQASGELTIRVEETSILTVAEQLPTGTDLTNSTVAEVTVTVGGQELTTFGGNHLTIMIPVGNRFTPGQQYDVLVISDNGAVETLTGRCGTSDGQRYVTVRVNHLSTFVVLADTVEEIYTITATAGAGGRIEPAGETEVTAGGSQTYYITPDEGYVVDDVLVDWRSVGAVDSYTFRNVDADHEIRATFRRGVEIPDFGPVIGSVYISVENNTYSGGDFRGTLVSGWYDLCARDTMMTSVLKALALGGYSWWGTGASDTGGYDITYLSGIYVDENENGRRDSGEPSLAEFDGARGAGWMGTLNDWFVNEGFQSFRANGSGNYELGDGDYLNVVYTCNLGEDVGSLWGNTDTSLASLRISGGTLRPSFDGDTLEYTLSISGNSARVTVTPTAVNKNYMVKTFLNYYNRDSTCYKRMQTINVKPGDVLYIGVGEPSWPSMNNQGSDAVNYTATRYTITVVSNNSAEAVIEMIEALPEITYANYKTQASKVSAARAAYEALDSKAKAEISQTLLDKLEAAEAKIEFYEEIDDVKDLLRALPRVDRGNDPSSSLIRQVKEAAAAYEDLNEEQKEYITSEDAERYEALRLWLIETGAVGPNELPIIDGSLVMPELDGIEVVLEPKATVDNSGKATASVTAAEFNALLEEAVEAEATLIVIAPSGAERASSISVELPRRALNGVIDETEADLAVRTHLGEMDIPSSTLANILDGTSGQDLTVHMERLPSANAENLLAGSVEDLTAERLAAASVLEVGITSGSKTVSTFGGHSVTLLLPVDDAVGFRVGETYSVYLNDDNGTPQELTGQCRSMRGSLWIEVTTSKTGTFVVVPPLNLPFTDVQEGDWFYDAVVYAYINELFNGTSATTFSPNGTMTRSMLVTVLWRMEGAPTVNSTNPFTDVAAGTWYTDAVVWANDAGIVNGTSATTFDPDGSVTREQIATILYRYAKIKGWDISGASSLGTFLDGAQVSDWAARAMEWTYAEGLITGKNGGRLDPQGQASRAEVATILMRLLESRS